MKNHLIERTISAVCFGILGFLFFLSSKYFLINLKLNLIYFSMVVSLFFIIYGFFSGFKTLLLPIENLCKFPARCIAIIWGGGLGGCIKVYGLFLIYPIKEWMTLYLWCISIFIGSVLGGVFLYKLFLLPKINYVKLSCSFSQRIVSLIWFGMVGGFLSLAINELPIMSFFILLLAAYFGFIYGPSIFLLPSSFKSIIKSMVIGIVISGYALLMVMLFFVGKLLIIDAMRGQFFTQKFVTVSSFIIFTIFPALSLFISGTGMVSAVLFYLISRLWRR
jgi:hypothetical protein